LLEKELVDGRLSSFDLSGALAFGDLSFSCNCHHFFIIQHIWLFKKVEVRLVHDEVTIRCLSDELIVFLSTRPDATLAQLDAACFEVILVDFFQNFEFSFELPLLQLMESFLVVLIAQLVNGDLPSLKKASSSLN